MYTYHRQNPLQMNNVCFIFYFGIKWILGMCFETLAWWADFTSIFSDRPYCPEVSRVLFNYRSARRLYSLTFFVASLCLSDTPPPPPGNRNSKLIGRNICHGIILKSSSIIIPLFLVHQRSS
jgi:hypothetical protein